MSNKRKLAVTGYRGIWGDSLTKEIAFEYVRAFARFIKNSGGKRILIGRDTRVSGETIIKTAILACEEEGLEITVVGIIPTPSVLFLVRKMDFDAGIMITASHNPIEYNGIKFIMREGRMINEGDVVEIEKCRENLGPEDKKFDDNATTEENTNIDNREFRKIHIDEILKSVDVAKIKARKFKVALDPINGTGALIGKELLEELGCEVLTINEKQDGNFSHPPEPLPENLKQLGQTVAEINADIGFAQDPDADRLVIVDETGKVISEEYTLTFVLKNILSQRTGKVVVNIQTSRMNEELAREYGQELIYAKVGEGNIVNKLKEIDGLVGGEGGGGAIYPKINTARDSLVGMALTLELLARENKKVSEIVDSLPHFISRKEKIPVLDSVEDIYRKLKDEFKDAKLSELDGVCFSWPDLSWLSLRPSTTEPLIRIIGEAKTQERINSIFERVKLTLSQK